MKKNNPLGLMGLIFLLGVVSVGEAQNHSVAYDDKGKRDPFWVLVNSAGNLVSYETDLEMTDLSLEGIMVGANGENLAVINSKVVKVSDAIGQFRVLRIGKNSVVLNKDQQNFELKLKKEE